MRVVGLVGGRPRKRINSPLNYRPPKLCYDPLVSGAISKAVPMHKTS